MNIIKNKIFTEEHIIIDNKQFINCTFNNCDFVYRGSPTGFFSSCNFNTIKSWNFEGEAQNTLEFIAMTYHGIGEGGKKMMENLFEGIRKLPPSNQNLN